MDGSVIPAGTITHERIPGSEVKIITFIVIRPEEGMYLVHGRIQ